VTRQVSGQEHAGSNGHGPVLLDIDGDGIPDRVTPAADRPGTDLEPRASAEVAEVYDDTPSVYVDPSDLPKSLDRYRESLQRARLEPVIPEALRTLKGWWDLGCLMVTFYGHVALFYAVRLPVIVPYVALVRIPKGFARALRVVSHWVTDEETAVLQRIHAHDQQDADKHIKLTRQRRNRTRWRWPLLLSGLAATLAFWAYLSAAQPPWWYPQIVALALVLFLAKLGTGSGAPMLGRAVTTFDSPKLTVEIIDTALANLGISSLTQAFAKDGHGVGYPAPITREKQGYRADIDLPHGVTAEQVVERRAKLASGLRRPVGSVWPMTDPDPDMHAGRLILWVTDRPFSKLAQPAWPLAKRGQQDMFKPMPFGYDQRGALVTFTLMFTNLLIGAIPRMGKTMALRVVLLAAAFDPHCEIHGHELKGTGDLRAVEPLAHRYSSGPGDALTLDKTMESVREVHSYLGPRAATLARLPRHMVPENKVTPELAARRDLGLHPVLLAIDEAQELFESEHRAEAETLMKAIIKRGPALGIMLVLSTQKPEKDAIPTSITSNMGMRLALRVMDWQSNDMILGTGAYKGGINATLLTGADTGIGFLRDGGVVTLVRSSYIDAVTADRIGARALGIREAEGTLTGDAVGSGHTARVTISIVDDVRATFAGDETGLWSTVILERLAALRPEIYAGWTQGQLTAALKAKGISAGRQVERADPLTGRRKNQRGVFLEDLPEAITAGPESAISVDDEEELS
jgi:S-DNA-T family DNA segregation ATPase FtsK/SpoIIIE